MRLAAVRGDETKDRSELGLSQNATEKVYGTEYQSTMTRVGVCIGLSGIDIHYESISWQYEVLIATMVFFYSGIIKF